MDADKILMFRGEIKMDEQKVRDAIKYFKKEIDFAEKRKSDCSEIMLSVFEDEIDTVNTVIEALEKQLPKKPKEMKYKPLRDSGWKYECPTCRGACGENVYHYDITKDEMYCTTCGQKLDWSE